MTTNFFDSIIMLRFGKTKVSKEELDKRVISMLIETKSSYQYLIGYIDDDDIRLLVLILPKMSKYGQTFRNKGDKDNNKKNKLMSFCIDDDQL